MTSTQSTTKPTAPAETEYVELGRRAHALLVIENLPWPGGFPFWAHDLDLRPHGPVHTFFTVKA